MNFLAPAAFSFLAAIPVVILFYLLKRKRKAQLVSSTLLWQKFMAETQANAPFQKLKHNWLLLLQILLLLFAIFALSRPYFASQVKGNRTLVVILDASASMQSSDENPNRFERARKEALQLVDGMDDTDQMVVLQAAAVTEVKQSPTSEKSALRRAINNAVVTDSPTRLNEALKLAETLISNKEKTASEIHLFSDGVSSTLGEFENRSLPLVYHKIGTRGVNLGIVNLDVRSNPENPSQRAVFTTIANATTNQMSTQVELAFAGKVIEVKTISLKGKETVPLVFIVDQMEDGVFTLKLDATDEMPADNTASIVSLLPQPVKVLLVTTGNKFLEKALKGQPKVELTTVNQLTSSAEEFDLVVLDNVAPIEWPKGNILAIHTAATNWFEAVGKQESPVIVDWKGNHPLLRFVNFDNIQIAETMKVKSPSWALPLVESAETPLILAGDLGKQRIVWVGFDSLQSTWPLRIAFPIFIANSVEYLNPASERANMLTIKAGDPFRLKLNDTVGTAEFTMPGGAVQKQALDPKSGELLFGNTLKQGTYQAKIGTNQFVFCVNLLDGEETATEPRQELQMGKYVQVATTQAKQANLELWRWLALTAFLILMGEWWYYHRRTA
ncbi:MAG: vWA domain-containing protein [Verrucomicrobiales bacterium]